MIILETKRLVLRHFEYSDEKSLGAIFGDPDVMRYGNGVQSEEWIHNWLRRCIEDYYEQRGYGPWAVIKKSSQSLIGYCGLFFYPDVNGRPEIELGYRLAQAAWGQGYATEAAQAVRDFAFNSLGLTRLIAIIDPHNAASLQVAEKAGMKYEGEVMLEGYTYPDRVYSITQDDVG
jgi:RimJ/RimL family protein N-acetyltransferase